MFFIGITLEKETFKVAVLKKEKKSIEIAALHTFPFGPDNVKQFYNLPPFHTGKKVTIASGLSGEELLIRKLHLPLKEKRKILATLPFQLETLIPFPPEEGVVCTLFKTLSKQMTSVTLFATQQSTLLSHLSSLKAIDIEPALVSCHPAALSRFVQWQFPAQSRFLVFHMHEQRVTCLLVENGELVLSQTILFEKTEELPLELAKFSFFLKQKGIGEEQIPWVWIGDPSVRETLKDIFPGAELSIEDASLYPYATALGLALDALHSDDATVQFCAQKFTPTSLEQKRKKKIFSYLCLCIATTLLTVAAGTFLLGKREKALAGLLQSYLSPSLAKGGFSSAEEMEHKLVEWEKTLSRKKIPFSLLPSTPKVSDVLAWISAHPAFSTEDGRKKEGIEIKSLHYTLLKYPKIGEVNSPYLAQVEIDFTATLPRVARDFHESLLKGDQIVNGKKEVKWQTQNQTYHTAFELKNP